MKVLLINRVYDIGSTGKIIKQISDRANEYGFECYIAHRYEESNFKYDSKIISASSWLDCHIHNRFARLTMLQGCFSQIRTWIFLKKIERIKPDIIHLHNIHGSFINHTLLFKYLKNKNVKVIWTLHDCWPFTGNCRHFEAGKCSKWKIGCGNCSYKGEAIFDYTSEMYKRKRNLFTGIKNMTIVTPSQWLADLVKESYLQEYPVKVINNGIDLNVFKVTNSDFRDKYKLQDKKIILGVAFAWGIKKGLDVFIDLSKRLDEQYKVVLVGTSEIIDAMLPKDIISIHKTNNQQELAEIYTAADVFVNPTREDNYPTVNMEAIACGTPVITFRTGGSPEMVDDTCGSIVECDDIDMLIEEIIRITKCDFTWQCVKKSKQFDMNNCFDKYISMYAGNE